MPIGLYYKTFLIYRTCMRPAPARPVRACFVRICCAVVVQGHDLRAAAAPIQREATSFFTLQSARFTPRTSHFTLALHTPHFISSHLISSELFSSHFISSRMSAKFFLTTFISSEHSSTFLILPKLVSTHLGSSARQKA